MNDILAMRRCKPFVWRDFLRSTISYVLLILGAIIMLLPFLWMILTSFKSFSETFILPIRWFPEKPRFDNYTYVLDCMNFGHYYKVTIIMTIVLTVAQLALASLAGYAFARLRFPGKNIIFFSLMTVFMVPGQMTLIPKFLMAQKLGWLDTYAGLIIPRMFSIYATFFMRQHFLELPKDLEESAKIDGASYFTIFSKVLLPLCTNALIALGVFSILSAWNEMVWPLLVTTTDEKRVLSVALATIQGQYSTKNNLMMAASILSTLPMLIVFAIGQKYIIEGIQTSGIKG